jgi:peptidoglycan L-alanyl-D-glutamate endopeptidase CwlK
MSEPLRKSDLDLLHPKVKEMTLVLLQRAQEAGLNVDVFETFRTHERSDWLYTQGRTLARGGSSYHNYGLAVDLVFKDASGQWTWNSAQWKQLGYIGKQIGFEWGGDWRSFPDSPHFQYTFGLSISDLLNGQRPPEEDVFASFKKWSVDSELWNDQGWDQPLTKQELAKVLNSFVKYLEYNYHINHR